MSPQQTVAALLVLVSIAAAPASQPTTRPDSYPAMRKRMAEMAAEITTLKNEINTLNRTLADRDKTIGELRQNAADATKPRRTLGRLPKSIVDFQTALKDVKTGMSLADVEWILGPKGSSQRRGSQIVYFWQAQNDLIMMPNGQGESNHYIIEGSFDEQDVLIGLYDHS